MNLDPAALLAGPRGRRVCLELVQGRPDPLLLTEPDPLMQAVFYAAYQRSREAGDAISLVTFTSGSDTPAEAEATPDPSAARIAELMAAQAIPEPSQELLDQFLRQATMSAMYWQGPDGADRLAAEPELRPGLLRAAEVLSLSPSTVWWASPVAVLDQWEVQYDDAPWQRRVDSAETLAEWRRAQVADEERWAGFLADGIPRSGDWWSTPPHALRRTTRPLAGDGAPAALRLVEDGLGWRDARVRRVGVAPTARVYEVDSASAWAELCRRYPLDVTASRRTDWARATGREGRWVLPDWSRVAEDHDGIHVSVAGYLETAGRPVELGDGWAALLAGWTPDETVWLNDDVTLPAEEDERWHVVVDGGEWTRARPASAG